MAGNAMPPSTIERPRTRPPYTVAEIRREIALWIAAERRYENGR
jgi:hypothetical protein